jgi:glycosyltransferase involved in cell wall biosynthesis
VRIAWVSPLSPMASGIADYSTDLAPLLAERASVELVSARPGRFRRPRAPAGLPVLRPEEFERRFERFDAVFYHLGNGTDNEFVYRLAVSRPAIHVFHDVVLHHMVAHMTIEGARDFAAYRAALVDEYGSLGAELARLARRRVASEYEKFLFPLNGRVARTARSIVVHSRDSAERLAGGGGGSVPVAVIPHHATGPPPVLAGVGREEARRRLGLPGGGFLVGHLGFMTFSKQPRAVLKAFARLRERHPDAILLIVGGDFTGGLVSRFIRAYGLGGNVRTTGFVDAERYFLAVRAIDAVVSLRFPTAGESSGTISRALVEGKAVISSNVGSFAEIPNDVTLKVEVDGDQEEELVQHLFRLADDPELRDRLGARARNYASTILDPLRCRDLYLSVAERAAGA